MSKKEIRFRKLVEASGHPVIFSLWTDPNRDRGFMKAVKEHRVLTVVRKPRAHRKDFGEPGFHPSPYASYLIFPKSLAVTPGARVIGISYELASEPRTTDPLPKNALTPRGSSKQKKPRQNKKFTVLLRRTGVIETTTEVEARNASEAREKALSAIKLEPFDGSKAVIKEKVLALH